MASAREPIQSVKFLLRRRQLEQIGNAHGEAIISEDALLKRDEGQNGNGKRGKS